MDKRFELWNKVEELFSNFEHHIKSPLQNEVKFTDEEIREQGDMMLDHISKLEDLTSEIIDYMDKNRC